jgi:hypothetical protein
MHLMRVLEVMLSVLARRFEVDASRDNWNTIIESIEKRIRAIGPSDGPGWKEEKEFFSGACLQFAFFKDAWRNHVMHARERYGQKEALEVLGHVENFAQRLSERLAE